ncbi:hypothetical protein KKB41_01445, partial [Patescibacteria group bacterium]|nr:hypothetical protein [Patescibacteria group bacterium]
MFTSNNLIKIIKLGVYAALLAPLIYIPQTIFGTVFGKMIYFQIIIELALPFFIYLIIFYKDLRPKIDLLTKLILLFFGIIFISSIFGVDFSQSFWGEMSRMRGIFTLLHLLAFYFYIITVFRTKSDRKQLLFFVLLVGFVMAIFGFFERLYPQINIDKTTVKSSAAHRVMSTTGNSIFFAGLLLFMFFLSVYCFFIEEKRYRFAFLPLAAFFALIMFYTGTRAALVGFIAGIFFAVIYLFFKAPKKKKAVILVGFLLVVTLLAGILGLSKI